MQMLNNRVEYSLIDHIMVRVPMADGSFAEMTLEEFLEYEEAKALNGKSAQTVAHDEQAPVVPTAVKRQSGPSPPNPEAIANYIASKPKGEHNAGEVMLHFAKRQIPTRVGNKQNSVYVRWVFAIKEAREIIEKRFGKKFDSGTQEGKTKVYRYAS
jgi:hypothetical protein